METIRSRQNPLVKRFIALASDGKARQEAGEYICAGRTLLEEALAAGAEIGCVLAAEDMPGLPCRTVTPEVLKAVSPLEHSPGPVFTVRMRPIAPAGPMRRALVLENVQDPGNVGTVLRTAAAFGIDQVVRASMGAVFRQSVVRAEITALDEVLGGLALYGAALAPNGADARALPAGPLAVAVGNEGRGLTAELLAQCRGTVRIPMRPGTESLNAAVAAAVLMWEMARADL